MHYACFAQHRTLGNIASPKSSPIKSEKSTEYDDLKTRFNQLHKKAKDDGQPLYEFGGTKTRKR